MRSEGDSAVLEVADRGPGVPARLRERIFERFARGDGDATRAGGSGLGLAIVKAVADAHGGRVELLDAPGRRRALRGHAAPGPPGAAALRSPG